MDTHLEVNQEREQAFAENKGMMNYNKRFEGQDTKEESNKIWLDLRSV